LLVLRNGKHLHKRNHAKRLRKRKPNLPEGAAVDAQRSLTGLRQIGLLFWGTSELTHELACRNKKAEQRNHGAATIARAVG
jgi:hypothetical protein